MKTKPASSNQAAKHSRPDKSTNTTNADERPLTITVEGNLARKIREHARAIGYKPKTVARQFLKWGHLMIDPSDEGEQFRQKVNAPQGKRAVFLSRDLVGLLETVLAASGTEWTAGEYLDMTIIGEAGYSVTPDRSGDGFQDFIANEFVLEAGDMPRMNRAARQWARRNPSAAKRFMKASGS